MQEQRWLEFRSISLLQGLVSKVMAGVPAATCTVVDIPHHHVTAVCACAISNQSWILDTNGSTPVLDYYIANTVKVSITSILLECDRFLNRYLFFM